MGTLNLTLKLNFKINWWQYFNSWSAGKLPRQRENLLGRKRRWEEAKLAPNPCLPPKAAFKPKFDLPKLSNYRGQLKASYWARWKSRKLNGRYQDKSWVSPSEMRKLSERAGMGR